LGQGNPKACRGQARRLAEDAGGRPARGGRRQRGDEFATGPIEDPDLIARPEPEDMRCLMGLTRGEFHPAVADALGGNKKPPVVNPRIAHSRRRANGEPRTDPPLAE